MRVRGTGWERAQGWVLVSGRILPKSVTPEPPLAPTSSGVPWGPQMCKGGGFWSHTHLSSDSVTLGQHDLSEPQWECDASSQPSVGGHPWAPSTRGGREGAAPWSLWTEARWQGGPGCGQGTGKAAPGSFRPTVGGCGEGRGGRGK